MHSPDASFREKRLSHLRRISLYNFSLIEREFKKEEVDLLSVSDEIKCFLVLESTDHRTLYVTETTRISGPKISFNEFSIKTFPINRVTTFVIKIVVRIPDILLKERNKNFWCVLKQYKVNLSGLQPFNPKYQRVLTTNSLSFQLNDGNYIMKDVKLENRLDPSALQKEIFQGKQTVKDSYSFNLLLKLNKMISYPYLAHIEKQRAKSEIEDILNNTNSVYYLEMKKMVFESHNRRCEDYIRHTEIIVDEKMKMVLELKEAIKNTKDMLRDEAEIVTEQLHTEPEINDEYGYKFSSMIQIRDHIDQLRHKKVHHLIKIFSATGIFGINGFVHVVDDHAEMKNEPCNRMSQMRFARLELKIIQEISNREQDNFINDLNTLFGYYLLFVMILSRCIFGIEVSPELHFFGSSSYVGKNIPFFISNANNAIKEFQTTPSFSEFNRMLSQLEQYM